MGYSDRLKELGLPTLQNRRLRYNMLQVKLYRMPTGIHNIENFDQKLVASTEQNRKGAHIAPYKT